MTAAMPKVLRGLGQRLRPIDDEQPGHARIEPPTGQVVEQRLDHGGVLGRSLGHCENVLVALSIDADRHHQDMVSHMETVDLDDQEIEVREVRVKPVAHLLAAQGYEAPGNGRLGSSVAFDARKVPLGQPNGAAVFACRDVQNHQVQGPFAQQVAVAKNLPALQAHFLSGAVANPWPAHLHLTAVIGYLACRRAPAVALTLAMAAVPGAANGGGVFLHHLCQGLDPGQQAEPVNTEAELVHGIPQSR